MIERHEFGHLVSPFLITLGIIFMFIMFCWTIDLQEYERRAEEKKEWLKTHTPDGLRLTFANE